MCARLVARGHRSCFRTTWRSVGASALETSWALRPNSCATFGDSRLGIINIRDLFALRPQRGETIDLSSIRLSVGKRAGEVDRLGIDSEQSKSWAESAASLNPCQSGAQSFRLWRNCRARFNSLRVRGYDAAQSFRRTSLEDAGRA